MKINLISRFNAVINNAKLTGMKKLIPQHLIKKMLTGVALTRSERVELNNAPMVRRDPNSPNLGKLLKQGSKR